MTIVLTSGESETFVVPFGVGQIETTIALGLPTVLTALVESGGQIPNLNVPLSVGQTFGLAGYGHDVAIQYNFATGEGGVTLAVAD